jgi:hypothetical protein
MPDVTEGAAQVGQMLLQAMQNTLGMSPDAAVAQAQATSGVSDSTIQHADMGQVFDYMCGQPGLSPEVQSYLTNASANYNSYGNVNQSGGSYTGGSSYNGGGSGGSGGYSGGGSGGGASNAQIVQQLTSNYNYQEINDNHVDILGNVDGDIDIDQHNSDIHDIGDGNAINTGDGNQNAATGDHSSAAQSEDGNAVSNSGDNSVTGGDDVDLDHSAVGTGNTVIDAQDGGEVANNGGTLINNEDGNVATDGSSILDNRDGSIDDHSASNGGVALDNQDGSIHDSSLGFGSGNVQGDVYNEEGAANSQGGDAHGHSTDVNVLSSVSDEHGPGDNNADHGLGFGEGEPVRETVLQEPTSHSGGDSQTTIHNDLAQNEPAHSDAVQTEPAHEEVQHEEIQHDDTPSEHFAPQADVHADAADDGGHMAEDHDVLHH